MNGKLLITGATGQVGRYLLHALGVEGRPNVRALVRREGAGLPVETHCAAFADLDARPEIMEGVGCVIHLAAHMGKGSLSRHREVTVEGTARLLEAAEAAGVERFLFVSSIAAGFEPRVLQPYPYAVAKREAEALVVASRMQTLILRPTLILGRGLSGHEALMRLAAMPVTPLFGDAELQPIDVRDIARAILWALDHETLDGRILDVGGPARIKMSELLHRMRGGRARMLRLPGTLVAMALGFVEPVLRPLLPLTAGQIQTFMQPGVAENNSLMERLVKSMIPLEKTLQGASRE